MKPLGGKARPAHVEDWRQRNAELARDYARDVDPSLGRRFHADMNWIRRHRDQITDAQLWGARQLTIRRYNAECLTLYRKAVPAAERYSLAEARGHDAERRRIFGYGDGEAA